MKNKIYFYSGTGNSYRMAEKLKEKLADCELAAITSHTELEIPSGYERIGFVLPVYFQGIPKILADFLNHAKFPQQKDTYYFAIATYGAIYGNAIALTASLLSQKGITLNYGRNFKMFSNYVVMYDMSKKVEKITERTEKKAEPVIADILGKKRNRIPKMCSVLHWYYEKQIGRVEKADLHFYVSNACVGCGRCAAVCASGNITMKDGRPEFTHHCNQCVACIQYCPQKAINYKNLTQNRGRYTHPAVKYQDMVQYYQ